MKLEKASLIKTDRIELSSLEEKDKNRAIDLLRNEEVKKTYMIPELETLEKAEKMFHTLKELSLSDQHFVYAIHWNELLIGFINDVEIEDSRVELGYVIHPDHKNRGYASEALSACIKELFRIGYKKVQAAYFSENLASKRVMEKCGMRQIDKTEDIMYRGENHHCIYCEIAKKENL